MVEGHTGKHKPLMGKYKWLDRAMIHGAPLYKKERTSSRGTYYYLYRHSQSGKWMITHKGDAKPPDDTAPPTARRNARPSARYG